MMQLKRIMRSEKNRKNAVFETDKEIAIDRIFLKRRNFKLLKNSLQFEKQIKRLRQVPKKMFFGGSCNGS